MCEIRFVWVLSLSRFGRRRFPEDESSWEKESRPGRFPPPVMRIHSTESHQSSEIATYLNDGQFGVLGHWSVEVVRSVPGTERSDQERDKVNTIMRT